MAERDQFDRLNDAIDAVVARRTPPIDPELAAMLMVAADLRELPDPGFRDRLRYELFDEKVPARSPALHLRPYLIVPGAAELIKFLERAFDAEVLLLVPMEDGTIMHAEVRVGNSIVEMGDASDRWKAIAPPMHVYIENADDVYRRAIAAGATSLYEPTTQAYGSREAGVTDRFGTHWYIATHLEGGPRPPGFGTVTAAIRVAGASQLIDLLGNAFGAVEIGRDLTPAGEIGHAEVRIGESMLEVSEARGQWGPAGGAFHLFVDDCDAVYEKAVGAGLSTVLPPADMPYGERSATVSDGFGNLWFIATVLAAS
jgi:uncharacterized glyoxalase superfamily protein PhnB